MCISHRPIFITTLCATLRQLLEVVAGRTLSHRLGELGLRKSSVEFIPHNLVLFVFSLRFVTFSTTHPSTISTSSLLSLLSIQIQHQPRAASRHAGIVNHDHDHLSDMYPYPGIHVVVRLDEADVGALSHHLFSNHECRMNASISRMHYQWI
jgi:hypothetical protein